MFQIFVFEKKVVMFNGRTIRTHLHLGWQRGKAVSAIGSHLPLYGFWNSKMRSEHLRKHYFENYAVTLGSFVKDGPLMRCVQKVSPAGDSAP